MIRGQPARPGADARAAKGWLAALRWLLIRRAVQLSILGAFLMGSFAGIWIVKGNLSSSLTPEVLPLTDPYVLLQSLVAGYAPASDALDGGLILLVVYALVWGRTFCAFVCPVNLVTDAAHWLHKRLGLPKGWQPNRRARFWILGATLLVSAASGTIAWELVNPVSMLHRGLIFGFGLAWVVVLGVFLFDLFVSRRGWCGYLCPVGAFYGLIGSYSLVKIGRAHV